MTRQWFSVPRWNSPDWDRLDIEGVRLLDAQRHGRKLRRGAHRRNRFDIVMRGDPCDPAVLEARLQRIAASGVPNYFGEQRFGRNASNLELADAWASGRRLRVKSCSPGSNWQYRISASSNSTKLSRRRYWRHFAGSAWPMMHHTSIPTAAPLHSVIRWAVLARGS